MEADNQDETRQDSMNSRINTFGATAIERLRRDRNIEDPNEISNSDNNNNDNNKSLHNSDKESYQNQGTNLDSAKKSIKRSDVVAKRKQNAIAVGRFFSISLIGSIESGVFNYVNDVYIKYSIVAGPDWILTSGSDLGITQISRYRINSDGSQQFVWNQPITISYRSYNYFGWPQIILSVYNFDTFGNDQILGYGCIHLPITNRFPSNYKHKVIIYSPQSTSYFKQLLSWITRRKPELIDSNLFARGDCRKVLQTIAVGKLELSFNLALKDSLNNGYRS